MNAVAALCNSSEFISCAFRALLGEAIDMGPFVDLGDTSPEPSAAAAAAASGCADDDGAAAVATAGSVMVVAATAVVTASFGRPV